MTLFIIGITEHISVSDLQFCKHEDLSVAWERKSISSILAALKTHRIVIAFLESISISAVVSRLAQHFRSLIETSNIIDTVLGVFGKLITLSETIDIADFIASSKGHITRIVFEELPVIMERLVANSSGPSFRWRFNPWKKDSFDNEFDPDRIRPHIEMPTLPISAQLEMVKTVFKQKFSLIFKFKDD